MGADKAQLEVDGVPLARRIAGQISALGIPVTVLGNQPLPEHKFLADAAQYEGPLIALSRFTPERELIFVVSCDLVRFDARLVGLLSGGIGQSEAAIPVVAARLQPLCALYRREPWAKLAETVACGKRSIMAWIERLDVRELNEGEFMDLDPRCVLGANTPGEYAQALREQY